MNRCLLRIRVYQQAIYLYFRQKMYVFIICLKFKVLCHITRFKNRYVATKVFNTKILYSCILAHVKKYIDLRGVLKSKIFDKVNTPGKQSIILSITQSYFSDNQSTQQDTSPVNYKFNLLLGSTPIQ